MCLCVSVCYEICGISHSVNASVSYAAHNKPLLQKSVAHQYI